jgi:glucose/mannose transport system substrate-binding protein
MKRGLELLADEENVVPSMNNFFTEDTTGQFNDLWAEFSFNRDLTVEEAQERLAEIIETAD